MKAAIAILEASLQSFAGDERTFLMSNQKERMLLVQDKMKDVREALWRLGVEEELPPIEEFRSPLPPSPLDSFTPLDKL